MPQSDLSIVGAQPRPRLFAAGRDAEGKGIMVLRGRRVRVQNIEFRGARVADRNGAGIRIEDGPVTVADCAFLDNENGILAGNVRTLEIAIENSVFDGNGHPDGYAHNLYIGAINRLEVQGSYFTRARGGHLLKSRAQISNIRYCRLTGEEGRGSYEVEFPSGGNATLIANLIQQGPDSPNSTIVSFGAEGYAWPENRLVMAFNTLVNDRQAGGTFLRVAKGAQAVTLLNNITVGSGNWSVDESFAPRGTFAAARSDFAGPERFDFRPRARSAIVGRAGFRSSIDTALLPERQYAHIASACPIAALSPLTPLSPGAFQLLAS